MIQESGEPVLVLALTYFGTGFSEYNFVGFEMNDQLLHSKIDSDWNLAYYYYSNAITNKHYIETPIFTVTL